MVKSDSRAALTVRHVQKPDSLRLKNLRNYEGSIIFSYTVEAKTELHPVIYYCCEDTMKTQSIPTKKIWKLPVLIYVAIWFSYIVVVQQHMHTNTYEECSFLMLLEVMCHSICLHKDCMSLRKTKTLVCSRKKNTTLLYLVDNFIIQGQFHNQEKIFLYYRNEIILILQYHCSI
jgi:hypothetical protein